MTENPFDKVLGIVLTQNKTEQYLTLTQLEQEWFTSTFHKSIFDGMLAIKEQNNTIDILTLTTWLRENNRLEKETIYKTSFLTNGVGFTDTINAGGVINECWYSYSVRQCFLMVTNVNTELTRQQPRSNYILDQVSAVKELLTAPTTQKTETNLGSIESVLNKHCAF